MAVGLARSLDATVIQSGDIADLSRRADAILVGRVVAIEAHWLPERRRVESFVTLEVSNRLKGQSSRVVVFRVPGGQIGRYRSVMIGAPSFTEGETVVVFLTGPPSGIPTVLDLHDGVFRIEREPATGRSFVSPPLLLQTERGVQRLRRGDPTRRLVTLEDFSSYVVRTLAGSPSANPARPPR